MYNKTQLNAIDNAIKKHLIATGVDHVIYMDMSGNAISKHDNGKTNLDSTAFAALAAGNYAAVDAMAKLVGESEFSLCFIKAKNQVFISAKLITIHYSFPCLIKIFL